MQVPLSCSTSAPGRRLPGYSRAQSPPFLLTLPIAKGHGQWALPLLLQHGRHLPAGPGCGAPAVGWLPGRGIRPDDVRLGPGPVGGVCQRQAELVCPTPSQAMIQLT